MSRFRFGDLGDSTHNGPEDYGRVRVRGHPEDGLADSLRVIIDCKRRRITAYTQVVLLWYFKGDKHDILP